MLNYLNIGEPSSKSIKNLMIDNEKSTVRERWNSNLRIWKKPET